MYSEIRPVWLLEVISPCGPELAGVGMSKEQSSPPVARWTRVHVWTPSSQECYRPSSHIPLLTCRRLAEEER